MTDMINQDTRAALDRTADRLIKDAAEFTSDIAQDAKNLANRYDIPEENIPEAPGGGEYSDPSKLGH